MPYASVWIWKPPFESFDAHPWSDMSYTSANYFPTAMVFLEKYWLLAFAGPPKINTIPNRLPAWQISEKTHHHQQLHANPHVFQHNPTEFPWIFPYFLHGFFHKKKRFWQHFPMVFPMAFPLGPSSQLFRTSSSKPVSSGATCISSSGSRESRQEARRLSRTWPAVRTGWQWNSWENHGKTMGNHGRCGDFMVILWWLMEQLWWLMEIQWESMFFSSLWALHADQSATWHSRHSLYY